MSVTKVMATRVFLLVTPDHMIPLDQIVYVERKDLGVRIHLTDYGHVDTTDIDFDNLVEQTLTAFPREEGQP